MDVATNVIGLFSVALKAYQTISTAIQVKSESSTWDLRIRIERTRFKVWGRTLGFFDEKTGDLVDEGDRPDLDSILQIEGIQLIVRDAFQGIADALHDFEKKAQKWRFNKDKEPEPTKTSSKLWKSFKDFPTHVVLVVTHENMVQDLLRDLTGLNNSLEAVLSLTLKTQAVMALSSELLPRYSTSQDLDIVTHAPPKYSSLVSTARVKRHLVEMPNTATDIKEAGQAHGESETAWRPNPNRDFAISTENLEGFEPTPRRELNEVQWPRDIAQYKSTENGDNPSHPVLIEWRQEEAISPGFNIPSEQLWRRRNLLVELLHETSTLKTAAEYRVLDCLGYCRSEGRVKDGTPINVVGFVSKFPPWADGTRQPVSLQTLLRESFQRNSTDVPSLTARFRLAKQMAKAIYQLQCSGWLHRSLSSEQIVFFYEKSPIPKAHVQLDTPFLVGLQYSRPDDQSKPTKLSDISEGFKVKESTNMWGRLGLYLHPDFSEGSRRYQRSDDIYSLGIILFEIAFWEPAEAFCQSVALENASIPGIAREIKNMAHAELAAEVGDFYSGAVVSCLEGLRGPIRKVWLDKNQTHRGNEEEYKGVYKGEDPEHGLESDLMWKAVRQLEKCAV
ncbi:hypothetical protein CDV31_012503 [Fusarium ambrosium]|uniref:Uncharacterized protein n=1 Tax=Fusarium ambrosium TaxID=131363 RepID=A0A428T987_9HYPO|nr:hypothetical protein CDV31_012503 [Fusarium ambrosium]